SYIYCFFRLAKRLSALDSIILFICDWDKLKVLSELNSLESSFSGNIAVNTPLSFLYNYRLIRFYYDISNS
ncbi:hypothetical protein NAI72_11275, partial [Francisella tularensis subsp. holarctica]|uniref:hypothetical protein n=1 Tax=Francisella tularensis TaxID=263 RepID=UPI002381C4AE